MDLLFLFLFFFVIALLIILWVSLAGKLGRLEEHVTRLREDLRNLRGGAAPSPPEPIAPPLVSPRPLSTPPPPEPIVTRPTPPRPLATPPPPQETEPFRPVVQPVAHRAPPPPKAPTDWEKFIGENLISKIGIAILVLAIGFFVKYAIDNDWIGPVGRVGIGLLCGGILIGLAHLLRNQYKAFSSVLIGGGLAVLYFSIALAYHQYHLLGQPTSFVIMLVVTAFSVALSLLYNREELAIIALAGGFVTPFLVSNGSDDYQALFTYLLILNVGLLVIAYQKAWRILNTLAFGLTAVLFASWLTQLPDSVASSVYRGGAAFATGFYVLFFVVNIGYTIKENKKFIASDFFILLLNTCLYFGVSLYFLTRLGLENYKGLYCAVMGVIHIALSWLLFRKQRVDKNILYLLIGITLSFVSLTAPLQLHGHYITLFWASESVLLWWLFLQSKLSLIKLASRLVWAAMLISLCWDWLSIYIFGFPGMAIVFNKGCMTGLYCSMCCYALFRLQRGSRIALLMFFAGGFLLYVSGMLETGYQFADRFSRLDIGTFYLLLYTWVFIRLFTVFNGRISGLDLRLLNMILLGLGVVVYLFALPEVMYLQQDMLEQRIFGVHFIAHWVGAAVVLSIIYRQVALFRTGKWWAGEAVFAWGVAIAAVVFLSAEGQMLVNVLYYSRQHPLGQLQDVYNRVGLPILWGLCSFCCMWLGMRHKFRPLRIFSLVLFMVTLLKLFLFDIRDIPIAGKIAAFFCLGVLLLVVSFMYQRLKKIIIDHEAKTSE